MGIKVLHDPETGVFEIELTPAQQEELAVLLLSGFALAGALSADICSSPERSWQAATIAAVEGKRLYDLLQEERKRGR